MRKATEPANASANAEEGLEAVTNFSAFPVVGVGASAGGLEALTQLLRELPLDTGMGFVIVQHLAPGRESGLAEILSRATKLPVCEVGKACGEHQMEANHVYVGPPGCELIIEGGKLRLLPQDRAARHHGIDQFFRALAEDCGHKSIGVVLSGTMTDGTLGLESIKAAGGITFAQDDSAEHSGMPRSAVASGCVDFVLPPAAIAREIARLARHPYVAPEGSPSAASAEGPGHAGIAEIVHRAMGVDFTHYKTNTLHRRITRRMVLHKMDTVEAYQDHLLKSPEEIEALYQDILINVTSFFRDPKAFAVLSEKVFPKLLDGRSRKDPLRVWTLGCSTGEESYSIAIALAECAEAVCSDVPIQIFATDLNATGIAKARAGVYSKAIAHDVSAERLEKFFVEESGGYRICKTIRDRCIFSRHNVLGDPPFSRVDFISCRNVLIYMQPVLQQQIVPLLHYALKPGGFLWLGSSETTGTSRELFDVVDAVHKIYVRQPGGGLPNNRFRPLVGDTGNVAFSTERSGMAAPPRVQLLKEAERVLLTKYAPPGVIISANMEILHFRGDTSPYLSPAAGAASLNLLKMLREGLLVSVRAAILRAADEGSTVRENGLRVKDATGVRNLSVSVIPIQPGESNAGGFLVLFEEAAVVEDDSKKGGRGGAFITDDEVTRLTQELMETREYLQAIIEQQESVNEELQSANEEAQSSNEEMQSVNEELETSKEEIQSSNEELATVNEELHNRNVELSGLNDSLRLARDYAESIVASMRSPLVVLDALLRVKTASAAFYETFRVAPERTEGRLIYELGNGQWNIAALRVLLEDLLPQKEVIDDFEVKHTFEVIGTRTMLLNARRLVQGTGNEALIVLAIEDITDRRAYEASLVARAVDLVRADRSKDEFLAMLAHELRNPLAPLRNAAAILQAAGASAEACIDAQAIIGRQVGNMTRMIDDLLDVSRITEGKIQLMKEVVSLETIFNAAVSAVEPDIMAHGQELTVDLPDKPVFLNGDATRLDQIFGNLLSNACK